MQRYFFRFLISLSTLGLLLAAIIQPAWASSSVDLYLFYGKTCPHCKAELAFLDQFQLENPDLVELHLYEVYSSRPNVALVTAVGERLNISVASVPLTVIGDQTISGYLTDETTGQSISNMIHQAAGEGWADIVKPLLSEHPDAIVTTLTPASTPKEQSVASSKTADPNATLIDLPLIGIVNVAEFSLPALTIVLGFIDGFNPCAMWVLLYLISLLLGLKDRNRMWILGTTFIVTSALVYFVFLAAWLNVFVLIGFLPWIRGLVGVVAIVGGIWHLRNFMRAKDGCEVASNDKKQAILAKLRDITSNKTFVLALVSIAALAISVNFIELVCSAGIPAIYTQVLSGANLAGWQYYAYLLLYILVFMLDDLVIFIIAMITLKATGISTKYERWSSLVGGILILIIGVLLLFRPEWLMFG